MVTEGGRMLSAGERQLVCLARALVSQTQVFLMLFSIQIVFFLDQELLILFFFFLLERPSSEKPNAQLFQIGSE